MKKPVNKGGRPKGSPNRITWKSLAKKIIEDNASDIMEAFSRLDDKTKVEYAVKMLNILHSEEDSHPNPELNG